MKIALASLVFSMGFIWLGFDSNEIRSAIGMACFFLALLCLLALGLAG